MTPVEVLKKYWGHTNFRPLQETIIQSVLNGNDTLALLPTGGGKSVCFQVPALLFEGTTLVISPLIALMKDQVSQLKAMQIPAASLDSGMSAAEQQLILDNAAAQAYKLLYISPEKLASPRFRERITHLKLSLLVVDEAHCISQWGYDFRPSYLEIAAVKAILPELRCIALTASATPEVQADICKQLQLVNPCIFQKSFARPQLSYSLFNEPDKLRKLKDILIKVPGSAIVYVRNRRRTKEVAQFLTDHGIRATHYHAGLAHADRMQRQNDWVRNTVRVIVATNAFGMGINKPDVRVVVHLDVPESLEAYYQEAGRAGRDEKRAYAVLLFQDHDLDGLNDSFNEKYPKIDFLEQVYLSLANHVQLATGGGASDSYDFDFEVFCKKYSLDTKAVFFALKQLEYQHLIRFTESYYAPSRLFVPDHEALYKFQIANAAYDPFVKLLLRMYGAALYSDFQVLSERSLAEKLKITVLQLQALLRKIADAGIWIYEPQKDVPQLTFVQDRPIKFNQAFSKHEYEQRKQRDADKLTQIQAYITETHMCRATFIAHYFGEYSAQDCGVCDVCIQERKKKLPQQYNEEVWQILKNTITKKPILPHDLFAMFPQIKQQTLIDALKHGLQTEQIQYNKHGKVVPK